MGAMKTFDVTATVMYAPMVVEEPWAHHRHEAVSAAEERIAGNVLIDGEVWRPTSEPVYKVMTFGMGHNHRGTGLAPHIPWNAKDLLKSGLVAGPGQLS